MMIYDEVYYCKQNPYIKRIFTLYKYNDYNLLSKVLETDLNAWRFNVAVHIYIFKYESNNNTIYKFSLKFDSCILFDEIEFNKLYLNNQEIDLNYLELYGVLKNKRGDVL